jgi:hypothetical protein
MTQSRPHLDRRSRAALAAERQRLWAEAGPESGAWHAGSTVVSGVLLLGGVGWLLGRWTGWVWPTPVGILLGMAAALTTLWFRYGVGRPSTGDPQVTSTAAGAPHDPGTPDQTPMEDAA